MGPEDLKSDESIVVVDGIRLYVEDYGGDGGVLLFAHPTGFLGAVWRPIIRRLRARGFRGRIVTYDARGHGRSSKPDHGYAWPEMACDLLGLIRERRIERALGVGHSGGATTLALTQAEQPSSFRRLLMIDPILLDPEHDAIPAGNDNPMARRTETRRLVWSSRDEIFASYHSREPYDCWTRESLHAYIDFGTFLRPDGEVELLCPGRIEAQIYRSALLADPFSALRRLTVPVHMVRGERSMAFTEDRARRALAAVSSARLTVAKDCAHFVPMEKADLVTDLILEEWGQG